MPANACIPVLADAKYVHCRTRVSGCQILYMERRDHHTVVLAATVLRRLYVSVHALWSVAAALMMHNSCLVG